MLVFFFLVLRAPAQVMVHEEPRHHPVFQNKQIRILDVLIPPGDTSLYHLHHTPSVFIFLSSTTVGSQLKDAAPTSSTTVNGRLLFEDLAAPHLRVHRVWNMDTVNLHVLDVELISNDQGFIMEPLSHTGLALAIDTAWVRVYTLKLEKGEQFILNNNTRTLLAITLDSGLINTQKAKKGAALKKMVPGNFFEIKGNGTFYLKNAGSEAVQFALLEMPRQ